MKCSVVVTAYNQEATISQTLESILSQKCDFLFEILIGDDCSADKTREICLEYQQKYPEIIKPIFHKTNGGVATNFVLTIKEAKGKYIAVCAADDFWHNTTKLQLEVDFLESKPDYGFVYTDYHKLNVRTGRVIKSWLRYSNTKIYEGENLIYSFFTGKVPALTLTVMFRKDLYDKYIPGDDYINYKFPIEDWPTWLILSKYSKIGYIAESTATYRYGHESLSNISSYNKVVQKFTYEKRMYKYLCDRFPDDLPFDDTGYDNYVNGILLGLAYKKLDFNSAKNYAKIMLNQGSKNLKVRCATNPISFFMFGMLKKIKSSI